MLCKNLEHFLMNSFSRKLGHCGLVQVLLFSIEGQMKSMTGAELAASSNSPSMTPVLKAEIS
jgi:hypothetical protein